MARQFDMKKFLKESKILLREFDGVPVDKLSEEEADFLASIGNHMGMTGGPYLDAKNVKGWHRPTAIKATKKAMSQLTPKGQKLAKAILQKIS